MTRAFTTLAFSPSVRAAQARNGSRERMEQAGGARTGSRRLSEEMQERLRRANSIIVGTASREGWPHVQHRGGPRGFIKVLAPDELAFADYSGNRQYITVGNLAENDRMFLLLLDYAARHAAEDLGPRRGRSTTIRRCWSRCAMPDYPARVERVIRMQVEAWDTNCNSHIPQAGAGRMAEPIAVTLPEADARTTHLGIVLGTGDGTGGGSRPWPLRLCAAAAGDAARSRLELCAGGRDQHGQCGRLSGRRAGGGADGRAVRRQARLPGGAAAGHRVAAGERAERQLRGARAAARDRRRRGRAVADHRRRAGRRGGRRRRTEARPALALGVYFGGAGFGMVVSALAVPAMVAAIGLAQLAGSCWACCAVAATLFALPALARAPDGDARDPARRRCSRAHAMRVACTRSMGSYVLFGAGYIAYTTFIVAYLRNRLGFWPRATSRCSGPASGWRRPVPACVWGPLLARLSGGTRRGAGQCRGDAGSGAAGAAPGAARRSMCRRCCSAARS